MCGTRQPVRFSDRPVGSAVRFLLAVGAAGLSLLPLRAQSGRTPDGDWPMHDRDLAATRFSPLTQINTGNVATLIQAWSYRLREDLSATPDEFTGLPSGYNDSSPIVVNDVMYVPTGRRVLALDPETGHEIWRYALTVPDRRPHGVAYWPGDRQTPPRILFTVAGKLLALDARTGTPALDFGSQGEVDIVVPYGGIPTMYKDAVILGASVGEATNGLPGNSRAYDARTGRKLWEFHSVPQPGEVGHETWGGDSWRNRSGVNVWGHRMSVDEERGLVYMPFGGPSANFYGGDRPGNNLFGNSLVAVDAMTGRLQWYFQTVHHDIWDMDLPAAPGLVDIVKDGTRMPALALVGKTGSMFILDRVTGKPVFGVEERPVPRGTVPGEWYSPTQPFPLKPPPLARDRFDPRDIVTADDTNAAHAKACRDLYDAAGGLDNSGPFTPFPIRDEGQPAKTAINFPGTAGGVNWGGTATDPQSGYVFAFTHDLGSMGWIQVNTGRRESRVAGEGEDLPYYFKSLDTAGGGGVYRYFSVEMSDKDGNGDGDWPCQKPPWGRLVAVNANTGDIVWQSTLGITDELPEGKKNTGRLGDAGPIVTAGGLVFIGATNDKRLRAFDSKTGKELWSTKMIASSAAIPVTYRGKSGTQFVALIAAQTLVAFRLPDMTQR